MNTKLAYTIPEAAEVTGLSVSSIRRHIAANNLTVRYPTKTPIILATELEAWLQALPAELEK